MNNFFSKYSRGIIILETLLIAVLSLLLIREVNKPVPLVRDQQDLITHFDQLDLDRITEMIHRFKLTDCENQPNDFVVHPVSFRKDEL
ncbi:hypothetical protein MKX42_21065 [Paenibacillus sp. FSL R7-0204]|uniref:hypothetical protein n=1 Tax=Paenibacillus sp. FSL R7-0204 TaxID=2921675 RepID=UPI0030FB5EC2